MISILNDLIINGCSVISDEKLLGHILFKEISFPCANDAISPINESVELLTPITNYIQDTYLKNLSYDFRLISTRAWEGVDLGTTNWHCDTIEGFNCSFLLYLDDMNLEDGGRLQVRGGNISFSILPKKGSLIILNQNSSFQHRAFPSRIKRRVIASDWYISELGGV